MVIFVVSYEEYTRYLLCFLTSDAVSLYFVGLAYFPVFLIFQSNFWMINKIEGQPIAKKQN